MSLRPAALLLALFAPAAARAQGAPPPPVVFAPQQPPPIAVPPPNAPPPPIAPPPVESGPPTLYVPPAFPQAPLPPVQAPVPPPALGPGVVRLHLIGGTGLMLKRDSGPPVRVYDAQGAHDAAGAVCVAPCDATIDARGGSSFVFGGAGATPDSSSFYLSDHSGDITASVSAGSRGLRLGAVVSAGLAGIAWYLSLLAVSSQPVGESQADRDAANGGALGLFVIGGIFAAGGVILYLLSRTTYELDAGAAPIGAH